MIKKYIDRTKTSAQLMDALRRGYAGDREKTPDECPFSEQAIAYAFEELAPDTLQTMEAHLQSCRACMDLVLDTRTADIESQAQAKRSPKVLPALSDAINRPQNLTLSEKLAAGFRWSFMTLKIVATPVAVVCFMLIIAKLDVLDRVNTAINKTETTEWTHSVTKQISPAPGVKKKRARLSAAASKKDPAAVNSFSIREGWSIDPFEPTLGDKPRRLTKKRSKPRTPLEALDPSQLRLVGVMLSEKGNTALVEDTTGKGYVIRLGTYIGTHAGKVSQILKDRVIVEEKIEDVHGKIRTQKKVIKLNKP